MRLRFVFMLPILALLPAACDSKTEPAAMQPPASGAPKSSGAPAAAPTAAAAAADPTADFAQIAASCDGSAKIGECTEYKELGLLGDALKSNCEAVSGTYSTTARCPKAGRLSMCAAQTQKNVYYYKPYFELMQPDKTAAFCKETLMGTYHELTKMDAPAAPDKKK